MSAMMGEKGEIEHQFSPLQISEKIRQQKKVVSGKVTLCLLIYASSLTLELNLCGNHINRLKEIQ